MSRQVISGKEWTDTSSTLVISFDPSGKELAFQSPYFDKCGVEWQFSLKKVGKGPKTFRLSSEWHFKGALEPAMVNVVARWEPPEVTGSPPVLKSVTLVPNTLFTFDFGTWNKLFLQGRTLSLSVTILEPPPEQNSMTIPLPSTVSTNAFDSQAVSTASAIVPAVFGTLVAQPAVLQMISQSLDSGAFFDAKFIASTRRLGRTSDRQSAIRVVYAQTAILKAISPALSLDAMFAREDKLFLRAGTTPGEQMAEISDEYDYESDSDFDESEERDDDITEATKTGLSQPTEAAFEAVVEEQNSKSTLGEDRSHLTATASSVSGESTHTSDSSISVATISDFEDVGSEEYVQPNMQDKHSPALVPSEHIANVIYVKGTAYKTWRAFVFFCYTDQITFSPLKSSTTTSERSPNDGRDRCCSPKSMYRLAKRLGISTLETSALAAIEEHLSKKNILDELLSKFTSKYPVILEMEMRILMENRSQPEVTQAFPGMIQKIFQGQMPHAEKVLSDVMQKLLHLN